MPPLRKVFAYAAIYLLWGGSYLAVRVVVSGVPPLLAAGLRYSMAGTLLLAVSAAKNDALPSSREAFHCCASGALLLTVLSGAIFWASTILPSWVVAVLVSTSALWTYLAECFVLHTARATVRMLLAVVAGLLGTVALAGWSGPSKTPRAALGIAAVLLGSMSWSAGGLALKRIALPRSTVLAAGIQMISSGLCLLLYAALATDSFLLVDARRLVAFRFVSAMSFLVLGPSLLAFTAFHWLMRHEPASRVMTSAYINPVVAMLLGILLTKESCSAGQLWGAGAVLGSTFCIWLFSGVEGSGERRSGLVGTHSGPAGQRPSSMDGCGLDTIQATNPEGA